MWWTAEYRYMMLFAFVLHSMVPYLTDGASNISSSPNFGDPPLCKPGHYCPRGGQGPVPCPKGTFRASATSASVESCTDCPPHHYGPRPGLTTCLPCGAWAQQPHPGQHRCECLGEGQIFQVSDGQCPCMLGYRAAGEEGVCIRRVYEICRDGQARTQHGACLKPEQWSQHCSVQLPALAPGLYAVHALATRCVTGNMAAAVTCYPNIKVCSSPEDYAGFNAALGLCVCRSAAESYDVCGGWCRGRTEQPLQLVCDPELKLVLRESGKQVSVSGSALRIALNRWDSQGALLCDDHQNISRSVYVVQTSEQGFFGMTNLVATDIQRLLLENSRATHTPKTQADTQGNPIDLALDEVKEEDASHWSQRGGEMYRNSTLAGILNPIACLRHKDILLFGVRPEHYPQYDIENLYNTNGGYDWGSFRQLAQEMTRVRTPSALFSVTFTEPGVYALRLSSNQYKHMYVKVMPAGGQCYEAGPFFPTTPHHLTRLGVAKRRNLLLQPDWPVIGGLLVGAVGMISVCITVLVLFRDYGWPKKVPIKARYRALQLSYSMEDYSSKGSQVVAVKKHHRSLQAVGTEGTSQPAAILSDEFWDYEKQVDLEAFSTNTFYDILLKHSVSVTSQLSQLRGEVKQLYHRISGTVGALQLGPRTPGGDGKQEYKDLLGEVERERARRRALAVQLEQLIDSQLQMLRVELRAQREVHREFGARLREALRLLKQLSEGSASLHGQLWGNHHQHVLKRVSAVAEQMMDLVSKECQRQGAWAVLGEGTGARLLCAKRGIILNRMELIGEPCDGLVRACEAVHVDSCSGLILPNPGTHMRLASGHNMPVPPDFFLHPQTGRVLPMAGNVGYDPSSSTLVFTVDSNGGEAVKWEAPLLPFVPYPMSHRLDAPVTCRLRGLRQGQRMVLGGPMSDPDTGMLVPILAVTIHPQTGLVYPLGGLFECPFTHLPQPIQIGSPFLDPHTGRVALTTGVCLDHSTGKVLPVGGLLLGESFLEPLSGRLARVRGTTLRRGKPVPYAGGFQALLDAQTLGARMRTARLLCGSGDGGALEPSRVRAAAAEVEQAWRNSQHCLLQLITRLEAVREWAAGIAEDGGTKGPIQLPGSELMLPALLGMEYPDPGGSGLKVPVLGAEVDPTTGRAVALAGTMEDADGRGLVPIRIGARTVDPVTGSVDTVLGARLDFLRQTVVPMTVWYSVAMRDNIDSGQVEALQKEWCARCSYWRLQRQRDEDLLTDVDRAVQRCFYAALQNGTETEDWVERERQLWGAVAELHEEAQAEAQRRDSQRKDLILILPSHVLLLLTHDDNLEWEQHCWWRAELVAALDRVGACVDRLQQELGRREGEAALQSSVAAARLAKLWDELNSRQAELDTALMAQLTLREHSQLRADTAQAVLLGSFWYRDFGVLGIGGCMNPEKAIGVTQDKALPVLKKLLQLLEENKEMSLSSCTHCSPGSGTSEKQAGGLEADSQAWTTSVPAVKGASLQSLKDPEGRLWSQVLRGSAGPGAPKASPPHAHKATPPSHVHTKDVHQQRDFTEYVCVPVLTEEEWDRLLELSPLFHLLKRVEQQLRGRAKDAGLLGGGAYDRGRPFINLLDAQWECEGELIPLDLGALLPRELLVYQHGLFLLHTLHAHSQTPKVTLHVAASLPTNNYHQNAFRNSFLYQGADHTLYVRRQRLQSVGGFSLLLLHCVSHIVSGDMSCDTNPAFLRMFHKVLEVFLSELFLTRMTVPPHAHEEHAEDSIGDGIFSDSRSQPALHHLMQMIQRPARMLLFEDLLPEHLEMWREESVLRPVENLVRHRRLADRRRDRSPAQPKHPESQLQAVEDTGVLELQ